MTRHFMIPADPAMADLHMHTLYCDGANTPEEMVLSAMEKGLSCIGFSGHSRDPVDESCGMSEQQEEAYFHEITRLKEVYAGRIRILCGIEQDYYSPPVCFPYDYVIGSVHYVKQGGAYIAVDDAPQILKDGVGKYFGGDYYGMAETYYRTVSDVVHKTGADIIGHFDLVSKFNEKEQLFDERHPRYTAAWKGALDVLLPAGRVFEINTGGIGRGWKTCAYPSPAILEYIRQRGGRFVLSSDSHSEAAVGYGFEQYRQYV